MSEKTFLQQWKTRLLFLTRTGQGKRKDVKRAIVTLREGAIDIFGDQA